MISIGLCIIFIGISGALNSINSVSNYTFVMIISMILGTIIGELIDIEKRFIDFGEKLKEKTNNKKDTDFLKGFLTTSFTVAIGAMAVIGSIKDGIAGDYSILFAKSILDFIIVLILTASLGKGCIYSFIPVFVFEGLMTLMAHFIGPFLTVSAINNLSLIGSMLISVVGINSMFDKKIKVANMLPALLIAIILAYIF
jgi:uncharacterized membrane protein YqgA involved in biofilm formation